MNVELIGAWTKLSAAMLGAPDKAAPIKAESRAAELRLVLASIGLGKCSAADALTALEEFNAALRSLRLSYYAEVRLLNELIECLDGAGREASKVIKRAKRNG